MTGQEIKPRSVSSVLHPLILNGRDAHVASTKEILRRAGRVIDDSEARPDVRDLSVSERFDVLTRSC